MKVRDRLTGRTVTVPAKVVPGRFEVLSSVVTLNGHTVLDKGSVINSDGTTDCYLNESKSVFCASDQAPEESAKLELLTTAVITISSLHRSNREAFPSPLLPQKIANISQLLPLEKLLDEKISKGHLHEIARRPRLDMHYQEHLTQVSRARRLAPAAERHLSTDTSCWQQRTIAGIVPKSILALFSEDDYSIYENKVFVRLIDRLEKHLVRRLAQVQELLDNFVKAQRFQAAQDAYFRLYNDVCRIWGETFDDRQTSAQIDLSKSSVEIIGKLLRAVRVLKQSEIYQAVPRSCQVPDQIHLTNILTHDQHYRHLVPLWERHREETGKTRKNPAQRLEQEQEIFNAYFEYVGLVLKRALMQVKSAKSAGYPIKITKDKHEWRISSTVGSSLVFVPMVRSYGVENGGTTSDKEIRIPVFLDGEYSLFDLPAIINGSAAIVLSPLDFMVEEKMIAIMTAWIWRPLIQNYAERINRVPTPITEYLAKYGQFNVSGNQVFVAMPVPEPVVDQLVKLLEKHASADLQKVFTQKLEALDLLATCYGCGEIAHFEAREKNSFIADCKGCHVEWGVFTQDGNRKARFVVKGNGHGDFSRYGRWNMELLL